MPYCKDCGRESIYSRCSKCCDARTNEGSNHSRVDRYNKTSYVSDTRNDGAGPAFIRGKPKKK